MASHRIVQLGVLAASALAAACQAQPADGGFDFGAGTGTETGQDTDPADASSDESTGGEEGDETGDETGGDEDPPEEDVPHARGTIVLGESHGPDTTTMQATLQATFLPDNTVTALGCGAEIGGCVVETLAECGELGCEVGTVCAFNDSCQPTCQRVCDLTCAADEVCYFPVPDVPGCKKVESFDAGTLTFSGTTVPITLYPPYVLPPGFEGALALPNNEVSVAASGATNAGFTAFEATVSTPPTMSSSSAQLTLSQAFGEAALPVTWAPDQDEVVVTLTVSGALGGYGTVTCTAPDADGELEVPREAIDAAAGGAATSMQVAVERRRSSLHKGFETRGELLGQIVQPEGWVELVSSSVETATLTGCSAAYVPCGNVCADLDYDEAHCGVCDNACAIGQICSAGTCV